MELPKRKPNDIYLEDGVYTAAIERLRCETSAHDIRIGIVYAFDYRTHIMPFWYADNRMAPCSVRTLADVLDASGFEHIRVILQQWNRNFQPSKAVLDGRPLDVLLVSSMQVHAECSYDLIRDACTLGDQRPLIIAGGPKAIYEPTDFFELGSEPGVGADCAVTGESFVLIDLLETILAERRGKGTIRAAFDRARMNGALDTTPGLVYLSPDSAPDKPIAINTGVQRLLRDLDETPMPDAGYRLLEPPHRGTGLKPDPLPANKVAWRSPIASVVTTHGCKFNCSFCPIPAANQRTWRHKSAERIAAEIKHIFENFGIRHIFSTDDNFFNDRETVVDLMTAMAKTESKGKPLGKQIYFYTEATEFDVNANIDLLPLCREAGMQAIWFGIEDITADLINKGQTPGKTAELFKTMHKVGVHPMVMMIHSDGQPLKSPAGDLAGLLNQVDCLFEHGAVSYQCTYLGPAVGTRDIEPAAKDRVLFRRVAGENVPEAYFDGNHVVASINETPWERQMNILRAYARFYNPFKTLCIIFDRKTFKLPRLACQFVGQLGLLITIPHMVSWSRKLKRGPIERYDGLEQARIPMISIETGEEISWSVEKLPTTELPVLNSPVLLGA
jgi:radical SAM superfamily enzyme YgiQ (UPF0313 family)